MHNAHICKPTYLFPLAAAMIATFSLSLSAQERKFQADSAPEAISEGTSERDVWVDLINEGMTEWRNPYEWGEFKVADGEVHLTADKKFFLVSNKEYSDFVFEGEILLPEGQANSGFMVRAHVEPNKVFGYQAEVDGSDRCWSGGLYDEGRRQWLWPSSSGRTTEAKALEHEAESKEFFQKPEIKGALKRNDWNQYRMTCKGNKLKFEVNGVTITDYEDDMDASGFIGIQHHGEKGQTYKFRNLRIREL